MWVFEKNESADRAASCLICSQAAYQSRESEFMIFSNSLSALQTLEKILSDHPLLIQIQDMLHNIEIDQKEVFMWVPGHVGIHGKS